MAAKDRPLPSANNPADEWLTVNEFCAEHKISRRTFDRWRRLGKGPHVERLAGNGPIRMRRSWVNQWHDGDAA
jgi:hypothetical protein